MELSTAVVLATPITFSTFTLTLRFTQGGVVTSGQKVAWLLGPDRAGILFFNGQEYASRIVLEGALPAISTLVVEDLTSPEKSASLRIPTSGELDRYVDVANPYRPQPGNGLLSGSFPLSMVTQNGNLPSQSDIRILYRPEQGDPGDGIVMGTTTCNADGTWQVSGLNENLKFDIVARIPGFNDVLISNVQPTGAPLSAYFVGIKEEYEYEEEVSIQVVALGGKPPYVFEAVSLPDGLNMNSSGVITGNMLGKLDIAFNITVTDSENTVVTLSADSYVPGDPHWANVKLLTHLDGSEGGTSFIDETGKTITASGAVVTQSSGTKFGQCAAFSGGNLHLADSDDWHWTGGDFTVEFFISAPTPAPAGDWGLLSQAQFSGAGELVISVDSGRRIRFYSENPTSGSETLSSSDALAVDTMQHVAICRVGSTTRIFIDGVQKASGTFNGGVDMPSGLYIGRHFYAGGFLPGRDFPGKLDEIRITKGVGRYTTAFTPPTEPFPNY